MKKILLMLLYFSSISLRAQDDLVNMLKAEVDTEQTTNKVIATFEAIKLINANTTETTKKKTLDMRITHRFGNMDLGNSDAYHTYYGLDNASNIRISFDYGITNKLSVGIGRSKMAEHIDGNLKFRFLEQKKGGMPISAAYYANVAYSAVKKIAGDDFLNRLSYTHQLIIASKLNRIISLEVLPTLVHRNFVDQSIVHPNNKAVDENDLFALGFGGRFKITKSLSFVIDYFMPFSKYRDSDNGYYDALGVGIEIETGGHVFHVNLTNSSGIIENDYIPYTTDSWGKGEYKLGFNISRVFSF